MNDLPKPDQIHDEHGIHIRRADGTYSTHRAILRLPDGQVRVTLATGDTITTDEADARDITGWTGLIFTAEEKQAQQAYKDAEPPTRYVNGALENDPHPAYADYLAALERNDADAALDALVHVDAVRGYLTTRQVWDAATERVIVRFTRDYATRSGVAFKADDLGLARRDEDGTLVAMSARTGHNVVVPDGFCETRPAPLEAGRTQEYPDVECKYCGHKGIRVEWRLEAKPVGTWSLAGVQKKCLAGEWPYAICNGCGHESRGQRG